MRKQSMALDTAQKFQQFTESLASPAGTKLRGRVWSERFIKRLIDIGAALSVAIVGFPFFLAVALLIKLTSRGPIFYSQKRIGEQGRVLPFSSSGRWSRIPTTRFTVNSPAASSKGACPPFSISSLDEKTASVYKLTNDPRVTSVGNFLRKTSLDELRSFSSISSGEK